MTTKRDEQMAEDELKLTRLYIHTTDEKAEMRENDLGAYVSYREVVEKLLTPQDDEGFDNDAASTAFNEGMNGRGPFPGTEEDSFIAGARWQFDQLRKGPR